MIAASSDGEARRLTSAEVRTREPGAKADVVSTAVSSASSVVSASSGAAVVAGVCVTGAVAEPTPPVASPGARNRLTIVCSPSVFNIPALCLSSTSLISSFLTSDCRSAIRC